ncbi:MAG: FAD-dependent oxidoreductase [Cyclobacteriaceae bacterium]|nr:FAD-dependent oxidoreductase [Cyclobacteriaceae bacterium]
MKPTLIIGGGIVGLFTAYYLQKTGVEVAILDRTDLKDNCSTGNAGMITPSHIIPLAAPGMISKGIAWMFSSKSPFYIHPRLDFKLAQWCLLFFKASSANQVSKSMPYLNHLTLFSKALYQEFEAEHPDSAVHLSKKGLMMVYQTEAVEKEEIELAHLAKKYLLEAEVLSAQEMQTLEPNLEVKARGAVSNTQVNGFASSGGKISAVITDQGTIEGSHFVLCGGAWTAELAKKLNFSLPLMGGKGYSFVQPNRPAIQIPTILTERKVAVSPYGDFVRFGGTLEVAGTNERVNLNRVRGIFESIGQYYPDFQATFPEEDQIWKGLRPCSPDGLPYIGAAPGHQNVWVGAGHAMLGLTMAPATGRLLTELYHQKNTSLDIQGFEVGRYA